MGLCGVVWIFPLVAQKLNSEVIPGPRQHSGILELVTMQLAEETGPVTFEIKDDTGWPEAELGVDIEFPDSGLAQDEDLEENRGHDSTTPGRIAQGTLAEARAFLRGSVCPSGSLSWHEDWERPEREWSGLIRWAKEAGLILTGPGPEISGGREHDLVFEADQKSWVKFTKPDSAGFTVDWEEGKPFLRNAYPSEYLARLQRQNDLLEDRIALLGIWQAGPQSWRIVTRQPDVPGTPCTMDEIRSGMSRMGFMPLRFKGIGYEHSEAWRIGRMVVWDLHPSNAMQTHDGLTIPIDVIITPLPIRLCAGTFSRTGNPSLRQSYICSRVPILLLALTHRF